MGDEPMEVEPSSSNDAHSLTEESAHNSGVANNADENKSSPSIDQPSERANSREGDAAISTDKTLDELSLRPFDDTSPKEQNACNSSADKSENESNLHAENEIGGSQQQPKPSTDTDNCIVPNDSSSSQKPQTQAPEVLNIAEQSISSSDGSVEDVAKVAESEPKPESEGTQMVSNNNGQVMETKSTIVAKSDATKEPESTAGTKQDSSDDVVEARKDGADEEAIVESIDLADAEDDVQEGEDEEGSDEGIQEIHDVDDDDEESADAGRVQGAENATPLHGQVG